MSGHDIESRIPHLSAVPVPLPTDIPPPPDLSHLPSHILHSGSVETLIGQNEDLFARLKVNIRRNSVLEGQIMELERSAGELMRANQSLLSQLQVLQEKDHLWRDKTVRAENNQSSLKDELELLKTRFIAADTRNAELRPTARYQRRVRRWIRPMIDRLMNQVLHERKTILAKEAMISDLRARLSEASQYAQSLESQTSRDQARLVEQYEAQQKIITAELDKSRSESRLLREKASRLDQAVAADAASQNQIIFLERKINELQSQIAKKSEDSLHLTELSRKREQDLTILRAEADDMKAQLTRSQDQFEGLQTVWMETQKRLEAMKLQHDSLNQLNQELSRQLKEKMKEKQAIEVPLDTPAPEVSC
jgi:chromosome segregation ATPase